MVAATHETYGARLVVRTSAYGRCQGTRRLELLVLVLQLDERGAELHRAAVTVFQLHLDRPEVHRQLSARPEQQSMGEIAIVIHVDLVIEELRPAIPRRAVKISISPIA